jgi:hypothetical protein
MIKDFEGRAGELAYEKSPGPPLKIPSHIVLI